MGDVSTPRLDEEKWCAVVEADYHRPVMAYVHKKLPCLNQHDLDDIWQTALWEIIKKRRVGDIGKTPPSTKEVLPKLMVVARARAIDLLRKRKRLEQILNVLADDVRGTRINDEWKRAVSLHGDEVIAAFHAAMRRLTPKDRGIWLRYVDEYPILQKQLAWLITKEVGDRVTESMVEHALAKGRAILGIVMKRFRS
jgi:DNA-directed RNA polymerase specialized sigma24 family protein